MSYNWASPVSDDDQMAAFRTFIGYFKTCRIGPKVWRTHWADAQSTRLQIQPCTPHHCSRNANNVVLLLDLQTEQIRIIRWGNSSRACSLCSWTPLVLSIVSNPVCGVRVQDLEAKSCSLACERQGLSSALWKLCCSVVVFVLRHSVCAGKPKPNKNQVKALIPWMRCTFE